MSDLVLTELLKAAEGLAADDLDVTKFTPVRKPVKKSVLKGIHTKEEVLSVIDDLARQLAERLERVTAPLAKNQALIHVDSYGPAFGDVPPHHSTTQLRDPNGCYSPSPAPGIVFRDALKDPRNRRIW